MALSSRVKRALIAFVVFDTAVIILVASLFVFKSDLDFTSELRELGVTVYPDVRPVREFELIDENLNAYTPSVFADRWTMLFFGFTSCPDICPLTMAELKKFYEQIDEPSLKDNLNIAMVSVDPERDDPETIGRYVNRFNDDFLGVTGDPGSIADVAAQFFVAYSETENQHSGHGDADSEGSDENYLISHSGHIALVNPDGNYHAVLRPPHRARDLATAYKMILESSDY